MTDTLHLDPESVEAVAQRVAEILHEQGEVPSIGLVDAAEIASRFGVSRDYLYDNADRLGAVRLGNGPRARLRFDPDVVADRMATASKQPATPARRNPRRRQTGTVELLPVHEARP